MISADSYDDTGILADIAALESGKQNKLTGTKGQIVGFDEDGNAIAQEGGSGTEYTAGDNITISKDNVISSANNTYSLKKDETPETPGAVAEYHLVDTTSGKPVNEGNSIVIPDMSYDDTDILADIDALRQSINNKQDTLSAGDNISIVDNVISASSYDDTEVKSQISSLATAVSADISALQQNKQNKLAEGKNISISSDNVISSVNNTYSLKKDETPETPGAVAEYHLVDTTSGEPVNEGNSIAIPDMRYDDTNILADIAALEADKQDKLTGQSGQVVSFDENGNVIARDEKVTEYKAGENISISEDNTISAASYDDTEIKSQISTLENDVNASLDVLNQRINGKQNTLSVGYGINISGNTIGFSDMASTRFLYTHDGMNTGGTTISSIKDFSVTSQTSKLSTIFEYMRLGVGSTSVRSRYYLKGYLSAIIKASVSKTYFAGSPISITMSQSTSFTEFAGFAIIMLSGTSHLCFVIANGKTLSLYPTEEFTISSGTSANLFLYL